MYITESAAAHCVQNYISMRWAKRRSSHCSFKIIWTQQRNCFLPASLDWCTQIHPLSCSTWKCLMKYNYKFMHVIYTLSSLIDNYGLVLLSLWTPPLHVKMTISSVFLYSSPGTVAAECGQAIWVKNVYFRGMLQGFLALFAALPTFAVISSTSECYHETSSTNNMGKVRRSQYWRWIFWHFLYYPEAWGKMNWGKETD